MNLKTEILQDFPSVDKRVDKFLSKTINTLEEQHLEITDYTKMILTMLVTQLTLYYKACDSVFKIDDITSEDSYKRKSKMPEISIMQTANDKILNLLDKISASPLSKAKIKKLNSGSDDTSAQELLENLIN